MGRDDEFVHQLGPVQVHLVHPLVLQLGDAELDVLLDGLHVPVELLPVASLELEGRAGQLLEVLGAPQVLGVVLAAGRTGAGEPVGPLQVLPPLSHGHCGVVGTVVVVDLLTLEDASEQETLFSVTI